MFYIRKYVLMPQNMYIFLDLTQQMAQNKQRQIPMIQIATR